MRHKFLKNGFINLMKKWQKIITWIICASILIGISVFAIYILIEQKKEKERKDIYSFYRTLVPKSLNSYPKIKNYYNQRYKEGIIEEPIISKELALYETIVGPEYLSYWCDSFLNVDYSNYKEELSWLFDEEITIDTYEKLNHMEKQMYYFPPMIEYLSEYKKDKKITYKEFCSLGAIYELSKTYENQLQGQAKKNNILR